MTATSVLGIAVVDDQPTKSRLTDRNGAAVLWPQIRELLLANSEVTYGCVHCDFTEPAVGKVRAHLGKCPSRPPREPKLAGPSPAGAAAVEQLLAQLAELPKVRAENVRLRRERDGWRARARTAERDLGVIRKALKQ